MSRTVRRHRKTRKAMRDGAAQHNSRGCEHHGSCSHCRDNRTHASRRRAPWDITIDRLKHNLNELELP